MKIILISFFITLIIGCNSTTICQRHYVQKGFIGKVTIYYNQKKGAIKYDEEGCQVYDISQSGECFTSISYKPSVGTPNVTVRYFEKSGNDILEEIFLFRESDYLKDSISNHKKKYVFVNSAGLLNSVQYMDYYIDYGENYQKHFYIY